MDTKILKTREGMVLSVIPEDFQKNIANFPTSNIADIQTDYRGPSPYHLNYCGFEHCTPGYQFGPSVRRSYLLHLITSGKGIYRVGEKTYTLKEGDIFLIYPGDVTIYRADQEEPWSYCWIGFSGYQADYILSQMGFSSERHVIRTKEMKTLTDCIDEMLHTHRINLANELHRSSLLLRFFAAVIEEQPTKERAHLHAKSAYAKVTMQYLTNHYMQKVKISDIADYIGIDRSYLTKSFRTEYQMSPQEFLIKLRMRKAAELLRHTSIPIASVAAQCGYPDALAFSRMFHQNYGSSPTEFRTAHAAGPVPHPEEN